MEIKIQRQKLKKLLDKVRSVVPQKSVIPAEEFIKIDVTESYIAVSVANTNVQCSVKDDFKHYEQFSFCVNGNDFIKAINKIKAKEITLNVEKDLVISFNRTKLNLPLEDDKDFIKPINNQVIANISLDAENLVEGIRSSYPFVVTEKLGHPMRDLWFNFDNGNLDVYATDKWIFNIFNTFCSGDNAHVSIMPEFAKSIQTMFDDLQEVDIKIQVTERTISFRSEDRKISVRRSTYEPFNYSSVIPSTEVYIDLKKDELLEVLPLAEEFSSGSQSGAIIVLKTDSNKLIISGDNKDYKTGIISELEILDGSAEFEVCISAKLLSIVVNSTLDEVVRLYADAPNKPVMLKEFDRTMLIMPIVK